MFPLDMVLFPAMPTALRVFEDRYLVMLADILQDEPAEFGVVLIERGPQAGGGDTRFSTGTIARIAQLQAGDRAVNLVAQGRTRVEVVEWLPDDPYPQASVRELPGLEWDPRLAPLRAEADAVVRRALAQASEFQNFGWSADAELSEDPVESTWQLAGIAPIGLLDQLALLRSRSIEELLRGLIDRTREAAQLRAMLGPLDGDLGDPRDLGDPADD